MGRRRGVMSESFKYELAKDLGFYDVVQREGWEGIRTKDAGNMVKRAIQIAEEHLAKQSASGAPMNYGQPSYTPPNYSSSNAHMDGSAQANYAQPSYAQNVYGSSPQVRPSHVPVHYGANVASHTQYLTSQGATVFTPSQTQPSAPSINQIIANNLQAGQVEQRPYYS